jgi:hypothetical protein
MALVSSGPHALGRLSQAIAAHQVESICELESAASKRKCFDIFGWTGVLDYFRTKGPDYRPNVKKLPRAIALGAASVIYLTSLPLWQFAT